MQKQHLDAVQFVNNLYDPQFVHDNAQYLEGYFVAPQFAALESTPLMPVEQDFIEWMGKNDKPIAELPGYGWIAALQLVHGLKLAGPKFSQKRVIDLLNRDTHFDADGMIVPIDWTKQHNDPSGPHGTSEQVRGRLPVPVAGADPRRQVRSRVPEAGEAVHLHDRRPERTEAHRASHLRELRPVLSDHQASFVEPASVGVEPARAG